jgi:hypothetical protein
MINFFVALKTAHPCKLEFGLIKNSVFMGLAPCRFTTGMGDQIFEKTTQVYKKRSQSLIFKDKNFEKNHTCGQISHTSHP